ncbi:hypothetical protein EDC04DRAFT_2743497 [Pisolithus marmoratus]|nr:hypothetical protein EDC04DRAFT_2743497 [Pisolithus marmoratus]
MSVQSCSTCLREEPSRQLMRCSRCKTSVYCSNVCQSTDWPTHKSRCSPTAQPATSLSNMSRPPLRRAPPSHAVVGVTIACNIERTQGASSLQTTIVQPSHPIYVCGIPSPISRAFGFPLLIYRHIPDDPTNMIRHPDLDNQMAMHLLTQPRTGSPDSKWRRAGCIGTVTVIRQDGQPLTCEALETVLVYVDHVLDLFLDGVSPWHQLNPASFQSFCQRYKNERIKSGYGHFGMMRVPL